MSQEDRKAALRVLIVLDGEVVSAWQAFAIAQLLDEDTVEVVGATVAPASLARPSVSRWTRAVLDTWSWFAGRRTPISNSSPPLQPVALPASVNRLPFDAAGGLGVLDVVVDFTSAGVDDLLPRPRYGIWSVSVGRRRLSADLTAGVCEAVQRRPSTEVALRVLRPGESARQLVPVVGSTYASPIGNRDHALWKASHLFARGIRGIGLGEEVELGSASEAPEPREAACPTAAALGAHALRRVAARFARLWARVRGVFHREIWVVAIRKSTRRCQTAADATGFRLVESAQNVWYADPFVIDESGSHYVFFEQYDRQKRRGVIAVSAVDDSAVVHPVVALERDHHLSYPFVFHHAGEIFLMPESAGIRQVQLFAPRRFPYEWDLEAILIDDVEAYDPTLFHDGERFWLFFTAARLGAEPHEELHLYSSRSLRGPYAPHPRNPIVADIRSARPAGALFKQDGRLFRPSQDCLERYGAAIQLNEVITLTPTDYRERLVSRIDPAWLGGNLATHTLNHDGVYEVIDGLIRAPRFRRRLR